MSSKHFRSRDDWRKAASELKSRLDTDFRNHTMLCDPWKRRSQHGSRLEKHHQPRPARLRPETA